jgi:hypothetical protein
MHPEHPDPEAESMWMRQPGIIDLSILPPHQSQEAPARQSAALPHTAVPDTSGSCFAVLIIPLATSRTAAPPINPLHLTPAPHTPVSLPPLTPAAGPKYLDLIHNRVQVTVPFPVLFHHINRQDRQVLLSFATRPDQVESINSWISGICKDYSGIIPLGAMHPEHPDPEVEIL